MTQVRAKEIHCHQGNCQAGTIAIMITGRLSAAVMISRRRSCRSSRSGITRTLGRQCGVVAGLLDGLDQVLRGGAAADMNGRLLRRVVDRGIDAFDPVELLLDPGRAGRAGHALNVELDRPDRDTVAESSVHLHSEGSHVGLVASIEVNEHSIAACCPAHCRQNPAVARLNPGYCVCRCR